MEHEQLLKLNPETGCYEATFTVRIEAEIFRRMLFNYIEEYHVDPTDLAAWEKAIHEMARTSRWLSHPRAAIAPVQERSEALVEPSPISTKEVDEKERKIPSTASLSQKEEEDLWEKAMQLPVGEWETLLTPLPPELNSQSKEKRPFYMRRYAERRSLDRLKERLEPIPSERMESIAEAMNGNRLR